MLYILLYLYLFSSSIKIAISMYMYLRSHLSMRTIHPHFHSGHRLDENKRSYFFGQRMANRDIHDLRYNVVIFVNIEYRPRPNGDCELCASCDQKFLPKMLYVMYQHSLFSYVHKLSNFFVFRVLMLRYANPTAPDNSVWGKKMERQHLLPLIKKIKKKTFHATLAWNP